ncbi:MAG: YggT family protein [Gammaproteobacteria bacterium]
MGNYGAEAAAFVIQAVSGFFLLLVMLRLLLQLTRADFYNPISQFIVKITNWAVVPLRRVIPSFRTLDMSSIVLLLIIQILTLYLITLTRGIGISIAPLVVISVAELVSLLLNVYLITIIAQAILSWVGPGTANPLTSLLYSLNEPVMRPARRIIPPISGIDLSPIVVLIVLQLLKILVVGPLMDFGRIL